MNYPIWDVAFGSGLLIALVSIVHVFVSHFAVGGGVFLVITEKKAYRENDTALLAWLQSHSKFFVLVTVVFGAVTGVGIWFTIGLVQPSATSTLIHTYVWGWASEWVFFFLEITAALMYLYGWEKLDRQTHLRIGWIYAISAIASMVIINGIITFMLTSGDWVETGNFWDGFFNPTYFPSLAIRFIFSLSLAGFYALLTASRARDSELKSRLVKWSTYWIIPSFIILPLLAYWYIGSIPEEVWDNAAGRMPTATRYAHLILIFSITTFVLTLLTWIKPKKQSLLFSLVIFFCAFGTMWSFEFIREAIRKPYVIADYMYSNSLYESPLPGDGGFTIENIDEKGVMQVARWVKNSHTPITPENQVEIGEEIFRVECRMCHTVNHYRGVQGYLKKRHWTGEIIYEMLGSLDLMHNSVMPPFTGTEAERRALTAYLTSLSPPTVASTASLSGEKVFNTYCGVCHQHRPGDAVFVKLKHLTAEQIQIALTRLNDLYSRMPPLTLSDNERQVLSKWIVGEINSFTTQ